MPHEDAVNSIRLFSGFARGSVQLILRGNRAYWTWLAFLGVLIVSGVLAYARQVRVGLGITAMRDQVSWGFYIGNFTFLVGVAAAAVVLVIPAYIYNWKPIREIVIYGELLAISAITMCLMFVMVDIGRPDRFWHLIPPFGFLNFPRSVLAWDVLVLNLYFVVNFVVATHILYRAFHGKHYIKKLVVPLVLLSVPMAVGIHTVTAFLYNGLAARPYWNSSILAPAVPGVGLLLGSGDSAGGAAASAALHALRNPGRGHLEDRRADGLRHVSEPVPARRRGVQGVLFQHPARAVHALLVLRDRQPPYAGSVRVERGGAEPGVVRAVHFAQDAAQSHHLEYWLPGDVCGRVHREGDGADHPGADAGYSGRDLRILSRR